MLKDSFENKIKEKFGLGMPQNPYIGYFPN